MPTDLSDRDAARLAGKHPRTIQRWCSSGKLPGAYKAGRSWRIPRRALRQAKLGEALRSDDYEPALRDASEVCLQIRDELGQLEVGQEPPVLRNWRGLARALERLEGALDDLPRRADAVPERLQASAAGAPPGRAPGGGPSSVLRPRARGA